ncbi:MAG: START-like domain-containing protein [Flavobacteriaceae bacterium]
MSTKKSFSIEYAFHASKQLLFQYLSTPSGLGEWFADNVNSRGEDFTFIWNDAEESAKLIQKKNNERVRFQWEDDFEEENDCYFEFKIQVDDLTNDVSLIVTDFAEEDEIEESKMLWDNSITSLKQVLGSS